MRRRIQEWCAGSCSVTLAAHGVISPVPYQGGKRKAADRILEVLGITRGAVDAVWIDLDPLPRALATVTACAPEVAAALRSLKSYADSPEGIWRAIYGGTPPDDPVLWAAQLLALQSGAAAGKPVRDAGGRWKCAGYAAITDRAREMGYHPRPRLEQIARDVEWIGGRCAGSRIVAPCLDLRGVLPPVEPGDVVLIDPPYVGTTGYSHDLPRARVLELARHAIASGADVVAICEAEPIPIGGSEIDLSAVVGTWGGKSARQAREWVSVSRFVLPRQIALLGAA